jgi:hypothetical protein
VGFFGEAKAIAGLPKVIARAMEDGKTAAKATEDAVPGLAAKGVTYLDDITAFDKPGVAADLAKHGATGFIDFPGFAAGDKLVIVKGSEVAGVHGVSGTATLTELTPTSVALAVTGKVGPLSQDIGVHLHQLTADLAEVKLSGPGGGTHPYLATINDARKGAATATSFGLDRPISVESVGDGHQLVLSFDVGGIASKLVLERAPK